jgi:imidazolonepropionase-like amidohydrolase
LVISDVTVISAERGAPLEHAYVRVLDGRIAAVSEAPLRGTDEIDGTGRFLIPGLIDSHVHLAVAPGWPSAMTPEQAAANPDIVAAALAQDPKSYLFFGFTTVVDLVGTGERTAQWNALELRPDASFCGGAFAMDGSFRRSVTPVFSYDQATRIEPREYTAEEIVASIASDGAICVKTGQDAVYPQTPEEGRALVAAAHARDLPVFIHANRKAGQAFAVAVGVDVIAHGLWREIGEPAALDAEAHEILASVARNEIFYQPTTQVLVAFIDVLEVGYLARPEVADAYPRALIDWYEAELAGRAAEQLREIGVDVVIGFQRETVARANEVVGILADADARLVFGSDTPSDTFYTNPPGLNGRLEMDNWMAAGVSIEKLFRALTIDNARMLRLDDRIGTVEAGKTANLLLLGDDPLESVEAYDSIETVFLHGRPIPRETLSARRARESIDESD